MKGVLSFMLEELMEAARTGDAERIRIMLQTNSELKTAVLPSGESPLTAALYHGKQAAVEALLECGVPVSIHEAAALGDVDTLDYMLGLEKKLIDEFSFDGWTPLHLACFFGGFEAATLLIERGADIHARSRNRMANMPIHTAAAGKRTAIVQLLLDKGADPNAQQYGGFTPLHHAVSHCDQGMTELLLAFGADPSIALENGKDARALAEEYGFTEISVMLNKES